MSRFKGTLILTLLTDAIWGQVGGGGWVGKGSVSLSVNHT